MSFPEVMSLVTSLLQFSVAGYALRLNRLFGTARVGWSLFCAFSLLALVHFFQAVTSFDNGTPLGTEVEVIYALISLLLLTGMVHIETLLRERLRVAQEEKRMRDGLELLVNDKTAHLTKAIGDLQQEIAERKQAERQLAESLDFNQKIISDATVGVIVFKASGQCVLANEAAARTLNATVPQLLKQDFRQLESWRDSGMLKMAEEVVAGGSPKHGDFHFTSTFGKEVWLTCRFSLFVRGDEPHLLLLFNDITERKRAEEQIREQASLLDLVPDAIMVRDLEDGVQYWNKSAERIYGWTAPEAIGRKLEQLLPKDVFNAAKYQEAGKAVMEKGDWQGELVTQTKHGQEVIIESRWTLVRDSQGKPKSVLAISIDVTEKKKLEAQFLRSQRMESLGTLAGGIGHDLNNILTPLLVSIQVLKGKNTEADRQKLLEALEANVQRGAGLVKQVLAFGRGVEGERAVVQPKYIAREIKQIVHETFPKSVEFELHCAPDLWTVTGDPTQLHQVLLNLCVNARDAMPNGGKLSIRMENVTFDETYVGMNLEAKMGPYVLIQVTDTGTGIPKAIQDRIFDPFFTTKEPGKGTGLGLSTTLAIVKSHGGFIHCQSGTGQGATFKVYLPASITPAVAEKPAAKPSQLPHGHNELVLIVDDEESILKLAEKALGRFGYRVLLASDGAEAVSLYASRRQEIAVVITDVAMPHLDGPATISALRTINPKVKIIGSSGLSSDGGRARIKDAGIQHFIPKPYTAETVLQVLHEVLQKNLEK